MIILLEIVICWLVVFLAYSTAQQAQSLSPQQKQWIRVVC